MTIKAARRASEIDIRRFERAHDVMLPLTYREFMKQQGGGVPEPCWFIDPGRNVQLFFALVFPLDSERMAAQQFVFPPPSQCGFVTIGTNAGGNYFLLHVATGEVYYWNHEQDDLPPVRNELLRVGSSIDDVIGQLTYWPGEGPATISEIECVGSEGDVADVEQLARRDGIDALNEDGLRVAEIAARDGNLPVLKRCIELGSGIRHLLHFAASGEDVEIVEYLLQQGAGINDRDKQGRTPLDRALYQGMYDFLLTLGAVHGNREKPAHIR